MWQIFLVVVGFLVFDYFGVMKDPKINLYLISVILFMFVFPIVSVVLNASLTEVPVDIFLIGKWMIFWAIGIRLFIAGIRQATNPSFTAEQIFLISSNESFPVIRELGFANICIGLVAMLSIFQEGWRMPAAITGGLYFGLAGLLHVVKKPESKNEFIALVSDLFIFIIMLIYCGFKVGKMF